MQLVGSLWHLVLLRRIVSTAGTITGSGRRGRSAAQELAIGRRSRHGISQLMCRPCRCAGWPSRRFSTARLPLGRFQHESRPRWLPDRGDDVIVSCYSIAPYAVAALVPGRPWRRRRCRGFFIHAAPSPQPRRKALLSLRRHADGAATVTTPARSVAASGRSSCTTRGWSLIDKRGFWITMPLAQACRNGSSG